MASIEESVRMANRSQWFHERTRISAATTTANVLRADANVLRAHVDLGSDDEDYQGQGTKRGRSSGEAPCDEKAPKLKRAKAFCPWMDRNKRAVPTIWNLMGSAAAQASIKRRAAAVAAERERRFSEAEV